MFLAHTLQFKVCAFKLVPSARLELAQLSPLPPQDSVSTNFTTTAALSCLDCVRCLAAYFAFQLAYEFTLIYRTSQGEKQEETHYFEGIWAAPELAGALSLEGTTGAVTGTAAFSKTLPVLAGRKLPK